MSELAVMTRDEGHNRTEWDPDNPAEVEIARAAFDAAKAKGYWAYKVNPRDDSKGDLLRTFDPRAGRIIMSPQPMGG